MIGRTPSLANVRRWATLHPTVAALVYRNDEISFGDLWRLIEDANTYIDRYAFHRGSVLAVRAQKTPQCVALLLAASELKCPMLVVPEHLGTEAKQGVYTNANVCAELTAAHSPSISQPKIEIVNEAAGAATNEDAVLILTTSGSTGIPKGVRLSRRAIENFFGWGQAAFTIRPGATILSYAPLNFDLSLLEVWAALDAGATVVLVDADQAADATALQKLVLQNSPDVIQGVPLLYRLLLQQPRLPFRPAAHIIVTGEPTPRELRQSLSAAFPTARFHNIYGSTETNDSFLFSANAAEFAGLANLPIGSPIAGTRYRILDDNGETLTGVGAGELHTSTPFAALGYTDARLTTLAFYEHEGERYYRTGDIVERHADGRIYLVGRRDHIVKVRGVRTNLKDIEAVLERHPGVEAAVVCPALSESDVTILHAVVQVRRDSGVSSLGLRRHCVDALPRSAIPSRFTITHASLPRTSTGKPDRRLISEALVDRSLDQDA